MAKSGSPGSSTPARRDRTVASPLSSMPADASLSAVTSPRASAGSEARVAVRGGVGSSRLLTLIGLTGVIVTAPGPWESRPLAESRGRDAWTPLLEVLLVAATLGWVSAHGAIVPAAHAKWPPSAFAQIRGHFAGVSEGGLEPKRDPLAFQAESVSPCNSTARLPTVVSRYLGTVPPGGAPIFSSCCRE